MHLTWMLNQVESIYEIEKFTYLKKYLKEGALAAIKGLALTNVNYEEALGILDQRYGNKQVIVNSHMDTLIKIPQVNNMIQTKKVRELCDEIETNLRSLKAIVVAPSSYGCLLIQAKIPHALNLHLYKNLTKLCSSSETHTW